MADALKCESYTIFASRVMIITQSGDCPTPDRAQADEHYKSSSEKRPILPHVFALIFINRTAGETFH